MDRRGRPRFEVVGQLAGSLETAIRCRVHNLGPNGACLECSVPLPLQSLQRVALEIDGQQTAVDVRVCHVRPLTVRNREAVYYVGVEFLSSVPAVTGAIAERFCRDETERDAHGV